MRILLVDDNEDAVLMLSEALDTLGYETRVAHDGPSGIAVALEFQPTVALLDIGLPVMDGYELARRLRERAADIQLIAITGYGQNADRCRSRDAGFMHHLVKPIDLERVATILDGLGG
jgi:CheY-like chemotaxis protein